MVRVRYQGITRSQLQGLVILLPCWLTTFQRVALVACGENHSLADLQRLEHLSENAPDSQKPHFIPAFFASLDPSLIPTSDELESPQPGTWDRMACAVISLHTIFRLIVFVKHPDAQHVGVQLWPCVWSWLYFIHGHEEHLASSYRPSADTYIGFLVLVSHIYGAPNSLLISSTPGFRVLFAKAWVALPRFRQAKRPSFELHFRHLAGFMGTLDFEDPENFAEIIEGAGGTLDSLVGLVLNYTGDTIEGQGLWKMSSQGHYVRSLVAFLHGPPSKSIRRLHPRREKFLERLRDEEFIRQLVPIMLSLLAHPESDTALSLLGSFKLLERLLTMTIPVGHRGFPDALDAHLLRLLADCTRQFPQELDSTLRLFLTKLLPDSLVYYHAVAAVATALDDVGAPKCKTLSADWATFIELAQIRVDIMNDLHTYMVSIKTCDNIECAKIRRRSRFRRCSGCNSFYYCSRECQTVDWKRGGHREHCASYTTLTLVVPDDNEPSSGIQVMPPRLQGKALHASVGAKLLSGRRL
ncbi:hypothetical protein DFH06DRAFT_1364393 [Mycena polygramma]|nr:hypothetical protein DFH06DRAFT_1364393 [Mycena polygramma]